MQTFGGGGGGGEGAMNLKDIFSRRKESREERVLLGTRAHRSLQTFWSVGITSGAYGRTWILCSTVEDLLKTGL